MLPRISSVFSFLIFLNLPPLPSIYNSVDFRFATSSSYVTPSGFYNWTGSLFYKYFTPLGFKKFRLASTNFYLPPLPHLHLLPSLSNSANSRCLPITSSSSSHTSSSFPKIKKGGKDRLLYCYWVLDTSHGWFLQPHQR